MPVLQSVRAGVGASGAGNPDGATFLRVTAQWPSGERAVGQFDYDVDDVYGVTFLNQEDTQDDILEVLYHPPEQKGGCCGKASQERWKRTTQLFAVPAELAGDAVPITL